ncbi:uncharacterized protein BJ212DRAFT_1349618 [Suillus subaureus]|uniref:Uncharacterized protein n=1 Tax=Suillus subaureus TaxID=48587 RepID=A0A9P7EC11_9AGAM|nr:uncharacterized protein BJ212DRAFT_1349618 [Suillus subaureus]KAG1817502.1 hypothetical protein BJ212DRAFT_1349618 [Suillus subaureus]
MLPSLDEDEIQKSVSSLQDVVVVESAMKLYNELDSLSETHFTYQLRANGLHDLLITTEDRLVQFWPGRPTLQTFLIVRRGILTSSSCPTLQICRTFQSPVLPKTRRAWEISQPHPRLRCTVCLPHLLEKMDWSIQNLNRERCD